MTSDKKVQKDLRSAAESLRDASEQLKKPRKRKKSRLGRLILFALVAAGIALVLSEDARKTVLDALFGAEEEFEYTTTTSIEWRRQSGAGMLRPRSLACRARHAPCVLACRRLGLVRHH